MAASCNIGPLVLGEDEDYGELDGCEVGHGTLLRGSGRTMAVAVFGPERLPPARRLLGQEVREFRDSIGGVGLLDGFTAATGKTITAGQTLPAYLVA